MDPTASLKVSDGQINPSDGTSAPIIDHALIPLIGPVSVHNSANVIPSSVSAIDIKVNLSRLKCTDQGVDKYLLDIKSFADQLKDIEKPLQDEDLITIALAGLPSQYANFITSLSLGQGPLPFEDLYTKLMHQEMFQRYSPNPSSPNTSPTPNTAFQTQTCQSILQSWQLWWTRWQKQSRSTGDDMRHCTTPSFDDKEYR
ncbi:hypothetical protein CRG98_029436 [Punica granatum]|uniref:Uncharacterized protein n=1 Tax=Punica granatum TaxID=22663 RepID=A0A2I0J1T1_PUNGR|nr:hypothetical protein CRG98_029436 [Punica granatum]